MSVVRRSTLTCLASIGVLAGVLLFASAPAWAVESYGVVGTFGSASSTPADPFPLAGPFGVAVNQSSGDVYVADRESNNVEYFSATGSYEGQFNGSANPGFPGGFSGPEGIAVDDSCFYQHKSGSECASSYPSDGDVYVIDAGHGVIDKLSATGGFISQLGPFSGSVVGVAVDSSGNVWVSERAAYVSEYSDTGTLERQFENERVRVGLAVDSADDLYLRLPGGPLGKFNSVGEQQQASETEAISPVGTLAVNLENNDLYVGLEGGEIRQYGPFGESFSAPLYRSGPHAVASDGGIAVNSTSHAVYVADFSNKDVEILGLRSNASPPAPNSDPVSGVRASKATLNGDLNPAGAAGGVGFYFSYAPGESCTGPGSVTTPLDNGGSNVMGSSDVHESVQPTGLAPSTQYAYCFVAENTFGDTFGPVVKFTTASTLEAFEPAVDSESVAGVTPFDAVLEARVTPENKATEYVFEYASKATGEKLEGATSVGSGLLPKANLEEQTAGPVDIGGSLQPGTTYYYRVVATNAKGASEGPVQSFTTPLAEKPNIEAQSSAAIGQNAVTLSGTLNPLFQPLTVCEFQYVDETTFNATHFTGTPPSTGCTPSAGELGSGDSGVGVGASVTGLAPNTTYYYRLVATNATGTSEGAPQSFLTLPPAPSVLTGAASALTPYSASITGKVDPGSSGPNSDTTYLFQYGTNAYYGSQLPLSAGDAGQGTAAVSESVELSGLEPGTTYHYRIVASNDNANGSGGAPQVVYGQDRTFTTVATPPVLGAPVVGAVTQSAATIAATLDAEGLQTHWELRLGSTPAAGLAPAAAGDLSGFGAQPLTLNVGPLVPGAVYYYKLVAFNADGTVQSGEGSFTTLPAPLAQIHASQSFPLLTLPGVAFPAEEAGTSTIVPKQLTNAQKLANALKACRKKTAKPRRAACEKQAHKKYGATAKKTKKTKAKKAGKRSRGRH
jgi:hypothetical protein